MSSPNDFNGPVSDEDGGEFNPLLDMDEDENVSGHEEEPEEELGLPAAEEITLPGFGSLRHRPTQPDPSPAPVDFPDLEPVLLPPDLPPMGEDPEDSTFRELASELGLDVEEEEDPDPLAGDSLDSLYSEDTHTEEYTSAWGSIEDELHAQDSAEDEDPFAGFDLDSILGRAIEMGASDVHISPDDHIAFTILGDIVRVEEFGEVPGDITQRLQQAIISHVLEADFVENLELDTAYVIKTGKHRGRRTRLSVGKSFGHVFLVFRVIADVIPTPEQLGISGTLIEWANLPSGLVLVCGPTGSGKSTTFASIIRKIQLERALKIITLEKPVEYVFGTAGKALITQREIGRDARTFSQSLTSAMRQAPDVIMVGEVRNQEEISELLRAAETGHLALSTIHSSSPPATINRIASMFEGEDRLRVLGSLQDNLRGLCNQVLVKSPDGTTRTAIREVLAVDEEVAAMVGRGDSQAIRDYQVERGITMDHELVKAVRAGQCTVEEARSKSAYPHFFNELMAELG